MTFNVLCEASVLVLLIIFYTPSAFFCSFDGLHEPSSALLGVLTARLGLAVLLEMLALRALVVVAVLLQVGFADPQLAPWIWRGFDGRLPLAMGRIFEPDARSWYSLAPFARPCGDGCHLFTAPSFGCGVARD